MHSKANDLNLSSDDINRTYESRSGPFQQTFPSIYSDAGFWCCDLLSFHSYNAMSHWISLTVFLLFFFHQAQPTRRFHHKKSFMHLRHVRSSSWLSNLNRATVWGDLLLGTDSSFSSIINRKLTISIERKLHLIRIQISLRLQTI